ncbi:hypothetical protein N9L09_00145 [Flavobacteriaceae bacterium]|nr:hypothetical protein [Flavobacteriaceae bacterium]
MKKIAFILFLSLCMFACKSEEKPSDKAQVEVPKKEKEWIVNVTMKSNKSDYFKLMMNNIEIDEFQTKNIHVIEKMEPTSSYETINARFGANNISKTFKIFLGSKEVKELDIKSIDIAYGDKSIFMNSSQITNNFNLNKFVEQDSVTMKIKTKRVDGKYYPVMVLKRKVINQLIKEN